MAGLDKFRALISKENWDQLIPVLLRLDLSVAADVFMDIPPAQQEQLFGRLPISFAAKLVGTIPYYDVRVLLQSRSREDVRAIVDRIDPAERLRLSEELPEEDWQVLLNAPSD